MDMKKYHQYHNGKFLFIDYLSSQSISSKTSVAKPQSRDNLKTSQTNTHIGVVSVEGKMGHGGSLMT